VFSTIFYLLWPALIVSSYLLLEVDVYLVFCCPSKHWLVASLLDPIETIFLVRSIYMTVAISMERYLGICHPHLQFTRRSLIFILPVILISFSFTLPMILNAKSYFLLQSSIIDGNAYHIWASMLFLTILPLAFSQWIHHCCS